MILIILMHYHTLSPCYDITSFRTFTGGKKDEKTKQIVTKIVKFKLFVHITYVFAHDILDSHLLVFKI